MIVPDTGSFRVDAAYESLLREIGLDADSVFTDARIHVWRSLPDRENATLDFARGDGAKVRLHVKRYPPAAGFMGAQEVAGYQLLRDAQVPAAPIIAHGNRSDGSSFIVLEDLAGYTPADKLIAGGFPFDKVLNATADLAALLHNRQLHHRDLYLCHFMIKPGSPVAATPASPDGERGDAGVAATVDVKLIDMARVGRMQSMLTRRRWIVKDLAQFWYSTLSLPVTDSQRKRWLDRYCDVRKISSARLLGAIQRKAAAIGRHDVALQKKQPGRNVSIGVAG